MDRAGDVGYGMHTNLASGAQHITGEISMKRVFIVFLALTSSVGALAVAQDGTGQGPPDSIRGIVTSPLPSRIPAGSSSTSSPKLSQTQHR
jgi:hypothetical protein